MFFLRVCSHDCSRSRADDHTYFLYCLIPGRDHRKQTQAEDYDSPDRPAEGGDTSQRVCSPQGSPGTPAR